MPDEPVTPQEPVVDVNNPEPAEPVAPVEPEPVEPQFMTADQVLEAVSKSNNETKTWLGRRDKDLLGQIGSMIEERLTKKVETPEELSSKLLEDPVATIRGIMKETQLSESTQSQQHSSETFTHLGNMMDSDPLYQDKDLGNELVEEVKKQFQSGKINPGLNPEAAAKVLHAEALSSVLRNRQKANPLVKNTPSAGTGTLTPGAPNLTPKAKVPELSAENVAFAKKWNFDEAALVRIFKGEDNPNHGPKH